MIRIPGRLQVMLAVVVFAQASTTIVGVAPAYLIPYLHLEQGMSLAAAGLLSGAPLLGLVTTLVAWGALADRFGERRVMLVGLSLTIVAVAASVVVSGFVALGITLVLSGALSACTNSSSGRLIAGWFPPERRGFAMGIRQTCQPLGMAVAALAVPPLALLGGVALALAFGGVLCVASLVACAFAVHDPEARSSREVPDSGNPYRGSATLMRIHIASLLLVVPQFALSTFGLVWFTVDFGWSPLAAGALVAVSQFAGAGCRVLVGVWSDRAGSRLRPLRIVAIAGIVTLLAAAAFGVADWSVPAAAAFLLASCVSVADNGLAFTAVAEYAGMRWAGRSLGIHNTGQYLSASAVGPAVGALIGVVGIPAALALIALTPALAAIIVPSSNAERVRG